MGSLILDLGKKKTNLPKQLKSNKLKSFISAQYSIDEIKRMLEDKKFKNRIGLNHDLANIQT